MKKSELRAKIVTAFRKNFDNIETQMIFPDEMADLNGAFPYITIVFDKLSFDYTNARGIQKLSIIGITKGEENLSDLIDNVEEKIFNSIDNSEMQIEITEVNNSNLFKPFGLDGGLFPPYGGVRFEIEIPNVKL